MIPSFTCWRQVPRGHPGPVLTTTGCAEEVLCRLNRGEEMDWLLVDWNLENERL